MTLILIIGVSLIAASGVLVLRSFSLANTERRRTLDQIAVYGFRAAPAADDAADVRSTLEQLATATGERALARIDGLRDREKSLRELLNSAGMYQTSVASFVGSRVLGLATGPTLLFLLSLTGGFSVRLIVGCALMSVMGWFLPFVRVQHGRGDQQLRVAEHPALEPFHPLLGLRVVQEILGQLLQRAVQGAACVVVGIPPDLLDPRHHLEVDAVGDPVVDGGR